MTDKTHIVLKADGAEKPTTLSAYIVVRKVDARFTGPILESYPVQAAAESGTILLESNLPNSLQTGNPGSTLGSNGPRSHRRHQICATLWFDHLVHPPLQSIHHFGPNSRICLSRPCRSVKCVIGLAKQPKRRPFAQVRTDSF